MELIDTRLYEYDSRGHCSGAGVQASVHGTSLLIQEPTHQASFEMLDSLSTTTFPSKNVTSREGYPKTGVRSRVKLQLQDCATESKLSRASGNSFLPTLSTCLTTLQSSLGFMLRHCLW